jgi:hypothetical protein
MLHKIIFNNFLIIISSLFLLSCESQPQGKLSFERTYNNNDGFRNPASIADQYLNPRMSSRDYIVSIYNHAFGLGINGVLDSLIKTNTGFFGDPCDIYENAYYLDSKNKIQREAIGDINCSMSIQGNNQLPSSSAVREGYRLKACYEGVRDLKTLNYLLSTYLQKVDTDKITNSDISKIYSLFYQSRPLNTKALKVLGAISRAKSLSNREKWQTLVYTICASPQWQEF